MIGKWNHGGKVVHDPVEREWNRGGNNLERLWPNESVVVLKSFQTAMENGTS